MQHQANNKYEQELLDNPALYHQMVYVPTGHFIMGSDDEGADENESPLVLNYIRSFYYMAKYPVTQALYETVMGNNPSYFKGDLACPVENTSWDDANFFCAELNKRCGYSSGQGYRLPTEAEWEYAAKGGPEQDVYNFTGSSLLEEIGWYMENNQDKPRPVGLLLPNDLELYDMSGNVLEWCNDWYADTYNNRNNDDYIDDDGCYIEMSTDHNGPRTGETRVLRGGYYRSIARGCRLSNRYDLMPGDRNYGIGFRLALEGYFNIK